MSETPHTHYLPETAENNRTLDLRMQNLIPKNQGNLDRVILKKEGAPAIALYRAAKKLLGPQMAAWECETVLQELRRVMGVDLPDAVYNKIFCCMALESNWTPFTQISELKNAILAFSNQEANTEIDEIVDPVEAVFFFTAYRFQWPEREIWVDYEPRQYLAKILYDEGFITAPRGIGFCQEELRELNRNPDLEDAVAKAIEAGSAPGDPILEAQIEKHKAVHAGVSALFNPMIEICSQLS